jgi:[methyl-Co(III) methanol-specific corrinoid protein]:coenzyme M methyltransferase
MWKKFVQPVITRIVGQAKGPAVIHFCGNSDSIIPMMCDTGVVGLSIEEKANLKQPVEIAHATGVRVFGNVSTATTFFRVPRNTVTARPGGLLITIPTFWPRAVAPPPRPPL